MFSRHHPESVRHRHPRGLRATSPRLAGDRFFLARDWIHPGDDDVPGGPRVVAHSPSQRRPIAPPPTGRRPMFSVMIPTFAPDERLRRTLEAVLAQDPGPETMQIAVVDDATPGIDVAGFVRSIDGTGRVEVHRHARRAGIAGNWNRALDGARGRYVHLLHQDDYVLPGFYERIAAGFRAAPHAGMAFCRSRIVDGHDRRIKTTSRQRWIPGVIADWLPRIAERQRVQTPAAVVARAVYERLGGYREDLCHALDWEMWVRIAAAYQVWYEPRALAVYRRHHTNESHRLLSNGAVWPDLLQAIELNTRRLPLGQQDRVRTRSVTWYARSALRTAEQQLRHGHLDAAGRTLDHLPEWLRHLPGAGDGSAVLRRVGRLRERLRGRRAA